MSDSKDAKDTLSILTSLSPLRGGADADGASFLSKVSPDRYEIGEEFAKGGQGSIREAKDLRLQRPVAIKQLLYADKAEMMQRFEREIFITAQLQHPGIVNVHDGGRWPTGEPFYTMVRVNGRDLLQVINTLKTLPERLIKLPAILDVAEAMAYAHSKKIIHRDLKPENILIGSFGETIVIDWGLAKHIDEAHEASPKTQPIIEQDNKLTVDGHVMGTLAYMAPEQAAGDPLDERADVYAIGAILYHLLSGQRPFLGFSGSHTELKYRIASGERPTPITDLVAGVPDALMSLIDKAMHSNPKQRYRTAQELAEDLRRFTSGQLVDAHRYSTTDLIRHWIARHRALVLSTVSAILVIIVAVSISFSRIQAKNIELDSKNVELDSFNEKLALTLSTVNAQKDQIEENNKTLEIKQLQIIEQLAQSRHEEGKAWLERGYYHLERKDDLAAHMMLARALNYDEYDGCLRGEF